MTWRFIVSLLRFRTLSRYGQLAALTEFHRRLRRSSPTACLHGAPTSTGLPDRESRLTAGRPQLGKRLVLSHGAAGRNLAHLVVSRSFEPPPSWWIQP